MIEFVLVRNSLLMWFWFSIVTRRASAQSEVYFFGSFKPQNVHLQKQYSLILILNPAACKISWGSDDNCYLYIILPIHSVAGCRNLENVQFKIQIEKKKCIRYFIAKNCNRKKMFKLLLFYIYAIFLSFILLWPEAVPNWWTLLNSV